MQGAALEAAILGACDALIAAEPTLTRLDTEVGDGDCGLTLKAAAEAIKADCAASYPLHNPQSTLEALGETIKTKCASNAPCLCVAASWLRSVWLVCVQAHMHPLIRPPRLPGAGSSGAFYHIMCNAAEAVLATTPAEAQWAPQTWAAAFTAAVNAVVKYGNATPGCCTMVDALAPAAEAMAAAAATADASPSAVRASVVAAALLVLTC